MPPRNPTQFFYGVTAQQFRSHIGRVWKDTRPKHVLVPCAGRFTPIGAFIQAGAERGDVTASDVSLFSSVIGELAAGRTVSGMGLKLDAIERFLVGAETEYEIGAAVLTAAKLEQIPASSLYAQAIRRAILSDIPRQREIVAGKLKRLCDDVSGINYRARDMREEIRDAADQGDTLLFLAMPTVVGDYTKMLGAGEELVGWEGVAAADIEDTTREDAHTALKDADCLVLSVSQHEYESIAPDWHVIATMRPGPGRIDYLIANRPVEHMRAYDRKRRQAIPDELLPLYDGHEITADSEIAIVSIDEATAMYYRDLLVHRLGATVAETYLAAIIDGQVFAVFGMHMANYFMGREPMIHEVFGVCMVTRYRRLSRLATALLRSGDTKRFIEVQGKARRAALTPLEGIQSVSLMPYPVWKTDHRGSKVLRVDKMPGGTFKVVYAAKFRDDTWQETLQRWVKQHARKVT